MSDWQCQGFFWRVAARIQKVGFFPSASLRLAVEAGRDLALQLEARHPAEAKLRWTKAGAACSLVQVAPNTHLCSTFMLLWPAKPQSSDHHATIVQAAAVAKILDGCWDHLLRCPEVVSKTEHLEEVSEGRNSIDEALC